uniref:IS200/IS605 family transposase n=1 Tax=Flavobacterium sp. TaxID=239 RepID=UPI00404A4158
MPFVKVYIHFVWSTKKRIPYLETKEIRTAMWKHIKENADKKGIFVDHVNGYNDHCHCLVSLGTEQTISSIMQLIKGESAFWFNQQNFITDKFQWQNDYFAISVSETSLERVRNYIKNQENHHQKNTYQIEYHKLINDLGFQRFQDKE